MGEKGCVGGTGRGGGAGGEEVLLGTSHKLYHQPTGRELHLLGLKEETGTERKGSRILLYHFAL